MSEEVMTCLDRYLKDRTAESFLALRRAFAAQPGYAPYARDPGEASRLIREKKFAEAREFIMSVMGNWMLNPGMHVMAHLAFKELGEEHEAEMENKWAALIMEGILSTGDGTQEHPYRVLFVADEYDVLMRLGKKPAVQLLVTGPYGPCDLQECEDGSSVYFDISVPISHLDRSPAVRKKWWQFWK